MLLNLLVLFMSALDSTKPVVGPLGTTYQLLLHLPSSTCGRRWKFILIKIAGINEYLTWNTIGKTYTYVPDSVKVIPIYGFTHVSASCVEIINMCMFCCSECNTTRWHCFWYDYLQAEIRWLDKHMGDMHINDE